MAVHDKRMCTVVSTRSRLLPTSRVCSSLNGSILQVASRCTDRQLPREHFYSPDKPKRCRLGMPPNSPQKSALCRAPPSQETTSASAASARAPEKILAFHDTFRRNFIERAKLWSCIPCTAACPSQKEKPHDSHERRYSPAREPDKMLASRDFSRFVCIEQREDLCLQA